MVMDVCIVCFRVYLPISDGSLVEFSVWPCCWSCTDSSSVISRCCIWLMTFSFIWWTIHLDFAFIFSCDAFLLYTKTHFSFMNFVSINYENPLPLAWKYKKQNPWMSTNCPCCSSINLGSHSNLVLVCWLSQFIWFSYWLHDKSAMMLFFAYLILLAATWAQLCMHTW